MANLDFIRTAQGSVEIDRNGDLRFIVNPNDFTIKLQPEQPEDTIIIRSGDIQVTVIVSELTSINGTPFVGTTEDAMRSLANDVFNYAAA